MIYLDMIGEGYRIEPSVRSYELSVFEEAENIAYDVMHEVYFGKTPNLLLLEKKIEIARTKYRLDPMKFNISKEREEIENIISNEFGFACTSFHVDPSIYYNAWTYPVSSSGIDFRDYRKYLIVDKKGGFKYKPECNAYVVIRVTKGLFFSALFTPAEIVGIILHEIGHNFQDVISGSVKFFNTISQILKVIFIPILIIISPLQTPIRHVYIDTIKKLEKNNTEVINAFWTINNILKTFTDLGSMFINLIGNISIMISPIGYLSRLPDIFLKDIKDLITSPFDMLNFYSNYRQEQISDTFAVAYGYGEESSSALAKMREYCGNDALTKMIRDVPVIGAYCDLLNLPVTLIGGLLDPHPNTIARLNNNMKYIKREIVDKEHNPKMKKELSKQVVDIQAQMDKMNDLENQGFFFSNAFDKVLLICFGGDIKSIFGTGVPENFDKAYERALLQSAEIKRKK